MKKGGPKMTDAQRAWLEANPNYQSIGKPFPGVKFVACGTLYADGRFDPMAPMKAIKIEPGSFGVGIKVHPDDCGAHGQFATTGALCK
jgi:hypothetical protein